MTHEMSRSGGVQREASFASSFSPDDPQERQVIDEMRISEEEARSYAQAVTSLHILAVK